MPRWVEHRTPSFFWIDGRVVFEVCNEGQQEAITSAFDGFVDGGCLDCVPGLRDRLKETWPTIQIQCVECTDYVTQVTVYEHGPLALCCNKVDCSDSMDLAPGLLSGLVRTVGGTHLDAKAAEHMCFNGRGATLPTRDDFRKFRDNLPWGNFTWWDNETGEVWGKSNGRRRGRCFQHSGWRDPDIPSGTEPVRGSVVWPP